MEKLVLQPTDAFFNDLKTYITRQVSEYLSRNGIDIEFIERLSVVKATIFEMM
jgi:hypothetical protein